MKIVHISTFSRGGAGIAAFRIHQALLKNGIDSHFICLDEPPPGSSISRIKLSEQKKVKKENLLNVLKAKIKWRLKYHFNYNIISQKEKVTNEFASLYPNLKCEIASLPFSEYDILQDPLVETADIIHLHWINGLVDYTTFFKESDKPVIWTLHDMNPFQGIFHYKNDEIKNEAIAHSFNRKVLNLKCRSIRNRKSDLVVVTPSKWILEAAVNSKVFKYIDKYYIPYSLNMAIFEPKQNNSLKASLNILAAKTVFLFVAQNTHNWRKGFDLLVNALKKINQKNITLLVIGNSDSLIIPDKQIIFLGTIEDHEILSNYYSISDALILPSREDNLPNVMLESIACGIPVISFDVGGMAEVIKNDFNGLKAKKIDADELTNVLNYFIKTKINFSREAIRNFALENFSEDLIAKKYKDVYKKLLKSDS